MKKPMLLVTTILLMASCQKQKMERINPVPEKVSTTLLIEYIDYEMAVQRNSLWGKPIMVNPGMEKFDAMINNFLANDRNNLRKMMNSNDDTDPPTGYDGCEDNFGTPIPCPPDNSGWNQPYEISGHGSVSCTGTFQDYNTVNTIVFTAELDATLSSIIKSSFAFGGIGGTWSEVGPIEQSYYDGVITYKQYYQESYNLPLGVTLTQVYVIYGNIYHGGCTTHGMKVPPSK